MAKRTEKLELYMNISKKEQVFYRDGVHKIQVLPGKKVAAYPSEINSQFFRKVEKVEKAPEKKQEKQSNTETKTEK